MSEIELKACPFCGSKPVMRERSGDERNGYNTSLALDCKCGASIDTETKNNGGFPTETVAAAKRRLRSAWNTRVPQWQGIESAPADELVVVCWLDDEDTENPERHEFDYIEDGMWVNHANLVEHAQAVAPPGSRVPKDHAPYQWWMPLPAPPEVEG